MSTIDEDGNRVWLQRGSLAGGKGRCRRMRREPSPTLPRRRPPLVLPPPRRSHRAGLARAFSGGGRTRPRRNARFPLPLSPAFALLNVAVGNTAKLIMANCDHACEYIRRR